MKKKLFTSVNISKAVKRDSFSDNTAKMVVFTETLNALFKDSPFIDPFVQASVPSVGSSNPPPPFPTPGYICIESVYDYYYNLEVLSG